MSVFTLRATDIDDEDAGWMRGCKILRVTLDEVGVTFILGWDDVDE